MLTLEEDIGPGIAMLFVELAGMRANIREWHRFRPSEVDELMDEIDGKLGEIEGWLNLYRERNKLPCRLVRPAIQLGPLN